MMADIFDSLARVRMAFLQANLEPPSVMLLQSHEEGMRFLSAVRQSGNWTAMVGSPDLGRVTEMADGSAWMEVQVMGIKVRWPANRTATPDGSWSYT